MFRARKMEPQKHSFRLPRHLAAENLRRRNLIQSESGSQMGLLKGTLFTKCSCHRKLESIHRKLHTTYYEIK